MAIEITCPACGRPLRVPDDLLGQRVKCPKCLSTFTATADEAPVPRAADSELYRMKPEERPLPPPPRKRYRDDDDDDDDEFDDHPRRKHYQPHRGTLILVLGVLAILIMLNLGAGFVTGIPAWIMGNRDLKKMDAGIMDPAGRSHTNTGRIMGMVCTLLSPLFCGCVILGIVAEVMKD